MISVLTVFIAVSVLFGLFLFVKEKIGWKLCVICASVSTAWIGLLVLLQLGVFQDSVLLALLMGQSIVGLYYLLDRKVEEKFRVFRLPFLLSATFVAYIFLSPESEILNTFLFLLVVWLLFWTLFLFRAEKKMGELFRHVLSCCKNW